MKIEKINIAHLSNGEHFQFHTEFKDLVVLHGAAALKIKPQFDAYLQLYEAEDEALKKIVRSEFTAKIKKADRARDNIWIGIKESVATAHRHFSLAVRDAAARLQIVLDTYGRVARKPLDEETSAVYNFLQDLHGKYAPDVDMVGIGHWVEELEMRNNALEALVKERDSESASRTRVVVKKARKAADPLYKQICDIINVYMVLEGEAAYESFAGTLSEVIARYKRKRHHRATHCNNENIPQPEVQGL